MDAMTMVKKVSYILLLILTVAAPFGTASATPVLAANHLQAGTIPESGSLIVLGSILISGASLLRRKWAPRTK